MGGEAGLTALASEGHREFREGRMPAFGFVVNDSGEVLLIQRGYGERKGKWSLPGGQRDKGESLSETARRETYEETGIRMTVDSLYMKGNRAHWEVWRGRHVGGHLRIQRRECLDAKWFQRDMLPDDANLAFGPDKRVIGKWGTENPGSRRVHYPQSRMSRAGFALVVNDLNQVLLIRRQRGSRSGKWSLPGGNAPDDCSRRDAAIREAQSTAGIQFVPERLYFENRHQAQVWLGTPRHPAPLQANARWIPTTRLPDDDSLAFAIDVRAIEKWAAEHDGAFRISYA